MEELKARLYPYDAIRSNRRRVYLGAVTFVTVVFCEVFIISLAYMGRELFDAWNMAVPVLVTAGISLLLLPVLYLWAQHRAQGVVIRLFREYVPQDLAKERVEQAFEGVCIACGVSPGQLLFRDDPGVNAITLGKGGEDTLIVISRGAADNLDRFELEALLAHEMYHVISRDTWFWTLGIAVGAIVPMLLAPDSQAEEDFRDAQGEEVLEQLEPEMNWVRKRGRFGRVVLSVLWVPLWLAFYCLVLPESRDALADAQAVMITRNPEALLSLLEKAEIMRSQHLKYAGLFVNHMFFSQPLPPDGERGRWVMDLFDTHVPLTERMETVQRMS